MPKIFDSNILISYFLQDSRSDQISEFLKEGCFLNRAIFYEVLNFLQNRHSASLSLKAAEIILKSPYLFIFLEITRENELKALYIMEKYLDNALSFVDALILAQAEYFQKEVYTTDAKMQNYREVRVINPFLETSFSK